MYSPGPHSRAASWRGFVLIELVLVLVIISMITAMVIPLYGASMVDIQRRSTRNQLVGILAHIQERAVSETVQYRFYLREETGEYWVERDTGTMSNNFQPTFEPIGENYGTLAKLPLDYAFINVRDIAQDRDREANYIRCFPNGASDAVSFSVRDTRHDSIAFTLDVLGPLGQIRTETPE